MSKPSISIIGTGRLGTALALALHRSGYPIRALAARQARHAENAARLLGAQGKDPTNRRKAHVPPPLILAAKDLRRLPPTDVILICTPDDAIEGLAESLAGHAKSGTVLHTSGALSSEALRPLANAGLNIGSIHPLVSVSDAGTGAHALRGAFYCVEGVKKAVRVASKIVADLNGSAFSIPSESKALYHAAAVMASPHATALFDLAASTLVDAGLDQKTAKRVLIPLLASTLQNLKVSDTADALTGTFARGDIATVKRHLKALSGKQHREARQVYKLLGQHSLKLAAQKGLDRKSITAIKKLLK